MNLLPFALDYLKMGMPIFPINEQKKPLVEWKELQTRIPTEEEVKSWWASFPNAGIGLATGKLSKVMVVDVEEKGDWSWLPQNTPIAKTGGGGRHYYYTYVDGERNKCRIKKETDIRGEGGYVVLPPSVSYKGTYEWIKKDIPCLPFPKNLFFEEENNKEYQAVDSEYAGYGEGQRNDQMTRYIGHLLAKIHPSEWDTLAWREIQSANQKNTPPLNESEIKASFDSIKAKEKTNTTERWYQKVEATKSSLWDNLDDEVLPLWQVAEINKATNGEVYSTGFKFFDDVIEGGFYSGSLVVLSAPTSEGKTTFAQNFTCEFVNHSLPVLWFTYEMMPKQMWNRFEKMGITKDHMLYVPKRNTTGNAEWIEKKIIEAKEKYMIKFVMIDHLGFLLPKAKIEEAKNYSSYLGQICRELKSIAIEQDIIIVLIAHMRKTEDPAMNDIGHSVGIGQEADFVFLMSREENTDETINEYYTPYTEITLGKNRIGNGNPKGWFTIDENNKFNQDINYIPQKKRKKSKSNYTNI